MWGPYQMKPLISVIIPVYDVEDYLARCLDSVIEQSYEHLEIIVVDDGSTDQSGIICDRYAEKDSRIKVIHQINVGLSGARNTGLDAASGEYTCFIDSDDYVDHDYVGHLYKVLTETESDMSVCGFSYTDDAQSAVNEGAVSENPCIKVFNRREAVEQALCGAISHCAWGKLYKAELFENVRFPVGKLYEDIAVFYDLLPEISGVSVSEEKLYYYTVRQGSIMTKAFDPKQLDEIGIIDAAMDKMESAFPDLKELINARRINSYLIVLSRIYRCKAEANWKGTRKEIRRKIRECSKGVLAESRVPVSLKGKLAAYMIGERAFFLIQQIADKKNPMIQ